MKQIKSSNMKTLIKYLGIKKILNRDKLIDREQIKKTITDNENYNSKNNRGLMNRVNLVFKKTSFIFSTSRSYTSNTKRKHNSLEPFDSISNSKEFEINLLANIESLDKEIIKILLVNFEEKYTTPFLLHSLKYNDDEIASILGLSASTVRSRIFYIQKRVQEILIEIGYNAIQ